MEKFIPTCDLYTARPDIVRDEQIPESEKKYCQIDAVRGGEKKCFHAQRQGSGGITPPNCARALRARRMPYEILRKG